MRGVEEGGPGGGWEMQPLSGLHRASDGYLGTVSRGQSGRGSAATAPAVVKPEPQAPGAGLGAGAHFSKSFRKFAMAERFKKFLKIYVLCVHVAESSRIKEANGKPLSLQTVTIGCASLSAFQRRIARPQTTRRSRVVA